MCRQFGPSSRCSSCEVRTKSNHNLQGANGLQIITLRSASQRGTENLNDIFRYLPLKK